MASKHPVASTGATLCAVAATVSSLSAFAAEDAALPAPAFVEEITVTAQKRAQSALDVPIALTAYSGDELATLGIEEFDRLSDFVPGLVVQEQSVNNPGFVIRGITSDSGSAQIAPRVSIYQDYVDVSRSRGSIFELFDVERVEVLKGPQATLFGSGASIGAISVVSAAPTETFEASLAGGLGNYDHAKLSGFASGPLIDGVLGARVAFVAKRREGFIDNLDGAPGSRNPRAGSADPLNGTDSRAVRGYLEWTPTAAVDFDLIVNYQRDQPPGTAFKSGTLPPAGGSTDPNAAAELGPFGADASAFLGGDLGVDRELWGATLLGTFELDAANTLTSITAYRTFESLEVFDADGTAAWWLEFAEDARGEQWSQELRVNHDAGGRFTGFAGVSFFHEEGQQFVPFSTDEGQFAACSGLVQGLSCFAPDGSVASAFPEPAPYTASFANTGEFDTFSVYADGTFAVTDTLSVTAGLRWLYEERRAGAFADAQVSLLTGGPLLPFGDSDGVELRSETFDFDDFVPRLLVSWQPDDALNVYASVGKGRRSPVIDASVTNAGALDVQVLSDETIWSWETGFKARLADGRVALDGTLFYQDYADFQTSIVDPASGEIVPLNAGNATNVGAEGMFSWAVTGGTSLDLTLAWLDAEFDDEDDDGNPQAFAGNRFRLQPEWSASVALDHRRPLTGGIDLVALASWTYRSPVFFDDDNAPIAGREIGENSVYLLGARIGVEASSGRWSVVARADNLLDFDYVIDAGNTGGAFGTPTFIAGPPRFWSVEATVSL